MNVGELEEKLKQVRIKTKPVLDNRSQEVENIHESEGVIYLEPRDDTRMVFCNVKKLVNDVRKTMMCNTQFEQGFHSALDEIEQSLSGLVN